MSHDVVQDHPVLFIRICSTEVPSAGASSPEPCYLQTSRYRQGPSRR